MTDGPGAPPPGSAPSLVRALCEAAMDATDGDGLDGVAVSRCTEAWYAGVVYASNDRAAALETMQETSGEGPGPRALEHQGPVLIDDLATNPLAAPWLTFASEAMAAGVRSVFVFPVQIGAAGLGLLTLHGPLPVDVGQTTVTEYVRLADAVGVALLTAVTTDVLPEERLRHDLLDISHTVTHQAVGMVSVQLQTSIEGAMAALRARAFSDGTSLGVVARKVVARTLTFSDSGTKDPSGGDGRLRREGDDEHY